MLAHTWKTDHQIEAKTKGLLYRSFSGKDIKVAQVLGWFFLLSLSIKYESTGPIIYGFQIYGFHSQPYWIGPWLWSGLCKMTRPQSHKSPTSIGHWGCLSSNQNKRSSGYIRMYLNQGRYISCGTPNIKAMVAAVTVRASGDFCHAAGAMSKRQTNESWRQPGWALKWAGMAGMHQMFNSSLLQSQHVYCSRSCFCQPILSIANVACCCSLFNQGLPPVGFRPKVNLRIDWAIKIWSMDWQFKIMIWHVFWNWKWYSQDSPIDAKLVGQKRSMFLRSTGP